MAERLFGIETEYALGTADARAASRQHVQLLDALMRGARTALPHLPDGVSHGVFLQNGARLYVDCGGHPELATPECADPWDVVRYVRAGESILLRLARDHLPRRSKGRPAFFRSNVDYSGTRTTWGCHESYMHRADPARLPRQIIPHLVSRLVYAGAGGFDNRSPGLEFTLSPRTAHMGQAVSSDSTGQRGIFHTKDEPLCGHGYHRLHVLCGESLCSELAIWLKVGTTALVVAMCEAGVGPGDGVELRVPVAAMRSFAADPTCSATALTVGGEQLTAIAIQRRYLAQAEAHAHAPFMPPWAGEVCRRWRAVLDTLDGGWLAASTTLDWAMKLALYTAQARRRGVAWTSLPWWTEIASTLVALLDRAHRAEGGPPRGGPLRADEVLAPASPIAAEVATMGSSLLRRRGLGWDGLAPFLALRDELFEIDTRFGQLGGDGIFAALDQAGALTHHVDGVGDIERAVDAPPAIGRARLRGALVRELSGHDGRYGCGWDGVWDWQEGKRLDLSNPFVTVAEWKVQPGEGDGVPPRGRRGGPDARRGTPAVPDPVTLNQRALEHRRRDELREAERLLRQAIEIEDTQVAADSPKRPHRRNNLAIVLLRAGMLAEAGRLNAEAWRLKAGQHDLTSGRILFVRIALRFLLGERDASLYLGQLKTLLQCDPLECLGDIAATWEIPDVLAMLHAALPAAEAELLARVAEALDDRGRLVALDAIEAWGGAGAMPLDAPWPEG